MNQNKNLTIARRRVDRAAGIVIDGDRALLMHRRNRGKEYYTFPGGGIEEGEAPEEAVLRELLEETSVAVSVAKILYSIMWEDGSKESFFLCNFISGVPKLAEDSVERQLMREGSEQIYNPLWLPLDELPGLLLYPLEIKELLLTDVQTQFSNPVRELTLSRDTQKQDFK